MQYNPTIINHMLDNSIPLTLHNYFRIKRKMFVKRTPEGWIIKNTDGETHSNVYPTARRANDALTRMTEGLIKFEPLKVERVRWNG